MFDPCRGTVNRITHAEEKLDPYATIREKHMHHN